METSGDKQIFPREPAASPTRMTADAEELTWWKPDWWEVVKLVGWRWVLAAPLLVVAGLLVAGMFQLHFFAPVWIGGIKLLVVLVAVPGTMLAKAIRTAVAARKDPFCIHCGYGLTGLPDHYRCPECGLPYSLAMIEEYRRNPQWFIERHKRGGQLPQADAPFEAGKVVGPRSSDGT